MRCGSSPSQWMWTLWFEFGALTAVRCSITNECTACQMETGDDEPPVGSPAGRQSCWRRAWITYQTAWYHFIAALIPRGSEAGRGMSFILLFFGLCLYFIYSICIFISFVKCPLWFYLILFWPNASKQKYEAATSAQAISSRDEEEEPFPIPKEWGVAVHLQAGMKPVGCTGGVKAKSCAKVVHILFIFFRFYTYYCTRTWVLSTRIYLSIFIVHFIPLNPAPIPRPASVFHLNLFVCSSTLCIFFHNSIL